MLLVSSPTIAVSPVVRLMLDEAVDVAGSSALSGDVLVVDDPDGSLTAAVVAAGGRPRVWCDDRRAHRAALAARADGLDPWSDEPVDAALAVGVLPSADAALDDLAERLAHRLPADARVVLGGRVKHMHRGQNDVLARHFDRVSASLGRQKSRVLHAAEPRPGARRWPRTTAVDVPGLDAPLTLVGRGAVFAAGRLDAGTRLLLQTLAPAADRLHGDALDLGSGSGVIAVWLARHGLSTRALDVSAAAVASTTATAAVNDVEIDVAWTDGLDEVTDASVDVLVSNPPFHQGAAKDSTSTLTALADAARVLRPGGQLWLVYNAHLPYLPRLREIGPTEILARDRYYLVTRTLARG